MFCRQCGEEINSGRGMYWHTCREHNAEHEEAFQAVGDAIEDYKLIQQSERKESSRDALQG